MLLADSYLPPPDCRTLATGVTTELDRPGRSRPRAELVLAVLAVLSLTLIPIHITTIYSGLPAHPLLLHVPVILIPIATIWALVLAARPRWFATQGVQQATVTVIALAGTLITIGAGIALRNALGLNGGFGPSALIARHQHAADILRLLMLAFTAVVIVTVLAHRIAAGRPTGNAATDRALASPAVRGTLRVAVAALAIACLYFVWHTGDLGAKAVWQGRLHGTGFGGGGFPGRGFGGGGGP